MADKKKKLKRQVSTDGGRTWQDMIPYEYIAGELIERDSPDCNNIEWRTVSGYICEENTTEMTQWVADTGYVCVGFDKYNKEKEQVSYNSGISWADTGNTRAGSTLIEANSTDCGYIPPSITRWINVPGEYVCVGTDKYNKEKEQISYDSGSTWTDTGATMAGSTLIEHDSEDCQGALLRYGHAQHSFGIDVHLPYKAWVENGTELYIKVTTDEDVQRQCFPGSTSDNPVWQGSPSYWGGLRFQASTSDYGTFTFVGSQIDDVEKSITMHHTFTPKHNSWFIVVTSFDSSVPSFDGYSDENYIATVTGPTVKENYDSGGYIRGSLTVSFRLTIFYKYNV